MSAQPTLLLDPEWAHGWERPDGAGFKRVTEIHTNIHNVPPFVPMWEFEGCDGKRVATQRPVNVSIQLEGPSQDFTDHTYVFACPSLHVYASATSYHEAEKAFQDQVVYFYGHYSELSPEELDDDARAIKGIYQRYFFERVEA